MISAAVRDTRSAVSVVLFPETDDARWDEYVVRQPSRSAYHFSGWPRLIARAFKHDAILLGAEVEQQLVGVLPLIVMKSRLFGRFVVSLPFLNESGVLADDPAAETALIDD